MCSLDCFQCLYESHSQPSLSPIALNVCLSRLFLVSLVTNQIFRLPNLPNLPILPICVFPSPLLFPASLQIKFLVSDRKGPMAAHVHQEDVEMQNDLTISFVRDGGEIEMSAFDLCAGDNYE